MDPRPEVADELLRGPGDLPADIWSDAEGENHSEIGVGEPGHAGDGIEAFHIDGKIKIIIGEPHELQYGRIAILSPDPGGGVVQPEDVLPMPAARRNRFNPKINGLAQRR